MKSLDLELWQRATRALDIGELFGRIGEGFLGNVGGVTGVVFGSLFAAARHGAAGHAVAGCSGSVDGLTCQAGKAQGSSPAPPGAILRPGWARPGHAQ
jgi:hypothetical protein